MWELKWKNKVVVSYWSSKQWIWSLFWIQETYSIAPGKKKTAENCAFQTHLLFETMFKIIYVAEYATCNSMKWKFVHVCPVWMDLCRQKETIANFIRNVVVHLNNFPKYTNQWILFVTQWLPNNYAYGLPV